jgi:hypothetical protein
MRCPAAAERASSAAGSNDSVSRSVSALRPAGDSAECTRPTVLAAAAACAQATHAASSAARTSARLPVRVMAGMACASACASRIA